MVGGLQVDRDGFFCCLCLARFIVLFWGVKELG